jgi:hypothetical protein
LATGAENLQLCIVFACSQFDKLLSSMFKVRKNVYGTRRRPQLLWDSRNQVVALNPDRGLLADLV